LSKNFSGKDGSAPLPPPEKNWPVRCDDFHIRVHQMAPVIGLSGWWWWWWWCQIPLSLGTRVFRGKFFQIPRRIFNT